MATTRAEHLNWCKERALQWLEKEELDSEKGLPPLSLPTKECITIAWTSFVSDMEKHEETIGHPAIEMGMMLLMTGNLDTAEKMKKFIEDFG